MTTISIFKNEREVEAFEPGQVVFKEGDPGDFMYAVIEGIVDIAREGHVIESVGEGGIFGELGLVDEGVRGAAAIAKTAVRVAVVDKKRFTYLVHEHPTFALTVMKIMSERLHHANEQH